MLSGSTILLWAMFVSVFFVQSRRVQETPEQVVRDLIKRLLPDHVDLFQISTIDPPEANSGFYDVFELESLDKPHGKFNFTIAIRGNNAVSISSGLNYYLKYYCYCQVTWGADQLNIPDPPPRVTKQRIQTQHKYRYYMNTCTHGYSAAWWDWNRWEREIDWMALNGINSPLAFTGQEIIWKEVYEKLKVPTDNFFTGPAFLPWNRMGNVNGWAGPLPEYWMQRQLELAKKILERERAYGMEPILPAFAGYVPPLFSTVYPHSKVSQLDKWAQGFNGTYYLDPLDNMFQVIGKTFIERQTELLGTNHLYNADPFNEETPPTKDVDYLSAVSKSLLKSMQEADPKSKWVMQGWFFVNDRQFWQPPQAKALLNAIPQDRLLLLDLWAEQVPIWNNTETFYNHSFVWCMLHNFGGRPGLYGKLHSLAKDLVEAKKKNPTLMQGIGLTPEAIENNPIAYDMLTDMTWRVEAPELDNWVENYARRRYGAKDTNTFSAWRFLQNSVYSCKTNQMGPSGSIVTARPDTDITYISTTPTRLFFNASDVIAAWGLFLKSADRFGHLDTFRYDLVDVTMQSLSTFALTIYNNMINAYKALDLVSFDKQASMFDEIMADMEQVLATNVNFLLGPWIQNAKKWGSNDAEKKLMEWNARLQITSWAQPETDDLTQYAYKLWSGMMLEFYKPRWQQFYELARVSIKTKTPIDKKELKAKVVDVERAWIEKQSEYPTKPRGDTVEISRILFKKYTSY